MFYQSFLFSQFQFIMPTNDLKSQEVRDKSFSTKKPLKLNWKSITDEG